MIYSISAGHDVTADAAEAVLLEGGNAFDAAIAALFAAFVAEPCMASGGGGGFANIYTADRQSIILDFFCQTPKRKRPLAEVEFYPVQLDFGDKKETYHIGKGASGTPGSIAGIFTMHQSFGSMPMRELVQPAIAAAKDGVEMNNFQHLDMTLLQEILAKDEKAIEIFFKDGKIKPVGEKVFMPDFADYMDYLSREGKAAFYQGEVAQKIVADYQTDGGYLTMDDFKNYQVIQRKGLGFPFRDNQVITNPTPALGGALLALTLNELPVPAEKQKYSDQEHIEIWYRTLSKCSPDPATLKELTKHLQNPKKHGSTTHFNIVDQWNNAISLTTTVGEGNGYFIEGTNIQMNNMLGEAALVPEGFHNWKTDVRLSTMMSPTIVLDKNGKVNTVLGSGGASRIPYAIAQVLSYLFEYGLAPLESVNAPRVHLEHAVFNIEHGFNEAFGESLRKSVKEEVKQWSSSSLFFGGVHALINRNGEWIAAADGRRDGVVRNL